MGITENPDDPALKNIDPDTHMQEKYLVLSEAERAKGYVRPLRTVYKHVGRRPTHPVRPLTDEERQQYAAFDYVAFEEYPPDSAARGRFWTQAQLHSGCDQVTIIGTAIASTYATDPSFYGGTYCAHCRAHFPIGQDGEFIWEDGSRVGT